MYMEKKLSSNLVHVEKFKLVFKFVVKWCMFLITAQQRFAISLGGDTGAQPDILKYRSCNLDLHFKSKTFTTNLEK